MQDSRFQMKHIISVIQELGLKARFNGLSGDKLFVVGYCGAGKTTFSTKLGEVTGVKVVHLDDELKRIQYLKKTNKVLYEVHKNELMLDIALRDPEPAIIEGISLLKSSLSLTTLPMVIIETNPWEAAWRQSWSKTQMTKPWIWALAHALYRNLVKWRPYFENLRSDISKGQSGYYFSAD
ncbi:MAG: hypothetical protein JNK26_02315 [Candidatus Doudnabacteria bacterium]|nr:hypothetical protein [Candidatus Doudnabacteria bacterium]